MLRKVYWFSPLFALGLFAMFMLWFSSVPSAAAEHTAQAATSDTLVRSTTGQTEDTLILADDDDGDDDDGDDDDGDNGDDDDGDDDEDSGTINFVGGTDVIVRVTVVYETYVILGEGATLVINQDDDDLTPVGTLTLSTTIEHLQVFSDTAYVAAGLSGLQIIDISNPISPTLIGEFDTPGYARYVEVIGNLAYVADDAGGLHVIDVSDPTNPVLLGTFDTPGAAYSIDYEDGIVYLADGVGGLHIIDVSDPANLVLLGTFDTPGTAYNLYVIGTLVYVADGSAGLHIIDVTRPVTFTGTFTPTLVTTAPTQGVCFDVYVENNIVYTTDWRDGIVIFDVSTPTVLVRETAFAFERGTPYRLVIRDDELFVASYSGGIQVLDVSSLGSITIRREYRPVGAGISVVHGGDDDDDDDNGDDDDDTTYLAFAEGGFQVIEVGNPNRPFKKFVLKTRKNAWHVKLKGMYAFLADREGGLLVINKNTRRIIGELGTPAVTVGVYPVGNLVYVADRHFGLAVVNVEDSTNPRLITRLGTGGPVFSVQPVGNYVYIANRDLGLQIVDVSDSSNPVLLTTLQTPGRAWHVQVVGNYAYVSDHEGGLVIVDVSDPRNPSIVGRYRTAGLARFVQVVGNYAYVADFDRGVVVIDVRDPANPRRAARFRTLGPAYGVKIVDGLVYVASTTGGMQIVQFTPTTSNVLSADGGSMNTDNNVTYNFASGSFDAPAKVTHKEHLSDTYTAEDASDATPDDMQYQPADAAMDADKAIELMDATDFPDANPMLERQPQELEVLPCAAKDGLNLVGNRFEVGAVDEATGESVQPRESYNLSLQYNESDLGDVYEKSVALYFCDNGKWVEMPGSVDTATNTIGATPKDLGHFAVMGQPRSTAVTNQAYLPHIVR